MGHRNLGIIAGTKRGGVYTGFNIYTDSLAVEEDSTYQFSSYRRGGAMASYFVDLNQYTVTDTDSGALHITRHDKTRRILAGRFWFDGTNYESEKVQIREGRFDVRY